MVVLIRAVLLHRGRHFVASFVHMTSSPAMIGYTRKMFRCFVGIVNQTLLLTNERLLAFFDIPPLFARKTCRLGKNHHLQEVPKNRAHSVMAKVM
jgi:hypothetical protein